ncbi:MAG: Amidohydrolase, partial [Deltaproteobacteria bacterium]|nr:Amidohydrolase [Deltaproteobacteria bacterium]
MGFQDSSIPSLQHSITPVPPSLADDQAAAEEGYQDQIATLNRKPYPSLDGMHFALHEENAVTKKRITASEYRPGSGEDWLAFLDRAKIERTVLFTSEGLSVGFIQVPKYAVEVCRAYNDYVCHRFAKVSDRLRPMALIPMQDVAAAVTELRRAVKELGLPGAMLPSCGLPLHLAHETYWPIYEEAEKLDLHHPIPLMVGIIGLIYHGVLDRFPNLRVAFMEGGVGWLASLLDRAERDENYFDPADQPGNRVRDYLKSGRILLGCE